MSKINQSLFLSIIANRPHIHRGFQNSISAKVSHSDWNFHAFFWHWQRITGGLIIIVKLWHLTVFIPKWPPFQQRMDNKRNIILQNSNLAVPVWDRHFSKQTWSISIILKGRRAADTGIILSKLTYHNLIVGPWKLFNKITEKWALFTHFSFVNGEKYKHTII